MSEPAKAPPTRSSDDLALERTNLAMTRSHLANERTHLAYLRTTVSLIGFGITLNRFSIYLQQNELMTPRSAGVWRDTASIGKGMVLVGLAVLMWSAYRFWATSQDIQHDRFVPRYHAVFAISLCLLLAGGLSALWLFRY